MNPTTVKQGDKIGVIAGCESWGTITYLSDSMISLQIDSPLGSETMREVPAKYSDKVRFGMKNEGKCVATPIGLKTAIDMLLILQEEEDTLMRDPQVLQEMINEHHAMKQELLEQVHSIENKKERIQFAYYGKHRIDAAVQQKYFPGLNEIVIDSELIGKLEDYLSVKKPTNEF